MNPKLKVVKTTKILPLMEYDEEKTIHLTNIILETETICTPLYLYTSNYQEYYLIQDSSILEASARLNIESLPAQVISSEGELSFEGEIFTEGFTPELVDEFGRLFPKEIAVCSGKRELKKLGDFHSISISSENSADTFIAFKKVGDKCINRTMFAFFDFLQKSCRLSGSAFNRQIRTANLKKSNQWGLLCLVNMDFESLLNSVRQRYLFPAGMLQFDTGGRIIGVNFPVNILNERVSIREKERFLKDLVSFRFRTGYPEYIGGGGYLLNPSFKK